MPNSFRTISINYLNSDLNANCCVTIGEFSSKEFVAVGHLTYGKEAEITKMLKTRQNKAKLSHTDCDNDEW